MLAVFSVPVFAELLVNPTGGTVLWDSMTTHVSNIFVARPLGFAGNFFGNSVTTVDVSISGNLNFSQDISVGNEPIPDAFNVLVSVRFGMHK